MEWDTVIGLEVHCQLNTKTKLFCGCKTSFGDAPNVNTCPICLGHPGVLPVLNQEALQKSIQAGLALECDIKPFSKFDRKNYFYPDLPKAYQITQFQKPICEKGRVNITVKDKDVKDYSKDIQVTRIHIEEDAGKLMHSQVGSVAESYVDLNRAGTPLIEIVSEPDMSSSDEAVAYLQKLKSILEYIGVSDCNMEQGSLRCDANVSIKPKGSDKLGNRTEIKNMNTFKGLQTAIEYEIKRQQKVLEKGGKIETETLLWDTAEKKTRSMRSKEDAHDYRYFPEPDLVPIQLEAGIIEEHRKRLPELPDEKKKRFIEEYKLSEYDASVLVSEKPLAAYYEKAVSVAPSESKKICNWIMVEVLGHLNEQLLSIESFKVSPQSIGEMMIMVKEGKITGKIAKEIFPDMIETGESPSVIVEKKGIQVISDNGAIKGIIQKVIDANPDVVEKYKGGNKKVYGFFVGQTMKETKGQASPEMVNKVLQEMLSAL